MNEPIEPNMTNTLSTEDHAEMKRLGILHVPVDTFRVGEYRYSNLTDAIAQAKRAGSTGAPTAREENDIL